MHVRCNFYQQHLQERSHGNNHHIIMIYVQCDDHHHTGMMVNFIMTVIIMISIRYDHLNDDYHCLCTMLRSSTLYDAIIIGPVRCDNHQPWCYAIIIMMRIIIIRVRYIRLRLAKRKANALAFLLQWRPKRPQTRSFGPTGPQTSSSTIITLQHFRQYF